MPRLRYVKTPDEVARAADANPEFLDSDVRSLRVEYETDPKLAAAVIPPPLEPADEPHVCVTFSHVTIHVAPGLDVEIGSAIFGVKARYEDTPGIYLVTMPMTTEQAVVPGRETYGEPKKIADITLDEDDGAVRASVSRMGFTYLSATGTRGEALGPREMVEHGYCFKAFPSCEKGRAFDQDPLLVRLEWRHHHEQTWRVDGELTLGESPFDPVADLPVRRLLRMELEHGRAESNGTVLGPVRGADLLPYLHQRYDDPMVQGIEV